jgi:hypothetical protein
VHNAIYVHDYPNLPAWLSAGAVAAAWVVVALTGILGYLLYTRVSRVAGVVTISVYALYGNAGLDHYTVAPIAAHTLVMNLTIVLEVVASLALLAYVARSAFLLTARTH